MNVLSLFDGMSCGQLALKKSNIRVDAYYASEVDIPAIKVTTTNFPNTIELGDVRNITAEQLPKIDLLIGGSPCQSFSFAGKRKGMSTTAGEEITTLTRYLELRSQGFEFEGQSYLFWEYVRLLKETKPTWFLLENVRMKSMWRNVITDTLGVDSVEIDSNLFSAQNRKRLYWTNIPIGELPSKPMVDILDILDEKFDAKYWLSEKSLALLKRKVSLGGHTRPYCVDVYNKRVKVDGRSPTLTHPCHNSIRFMVDESHVRKLTPNECEKLQTVPIDYTNVGISDGHRYTMLGNGWTVDVISFIFNGLKKQNGDI